MIGIILIAIVMTVMMYLHLFSSCDIIRFHAFSSGVRGPKEDWASWMWGLHHLRSHLSVLNWAEGSGNFNSPQFLRKAYVTVQTMVHDRSLYDPVRNAWTAAPWSSDSIEKVLRMAT